MVAIGPHLKWLKDLFPSWVFATEHISSGPRETPEGTQSLSSPRVLSQDSISESQSLNQDRGDLGRQQVSIEGSVESVRIRRQFSHDID